jgi:fructose-specific phosphotransferase system IIC component
MTAPSAITVQSSHPNLDPGTNTRRVYILDAIKSRTIYPTLGTIILGLVISRTGTPHSVFVTLSVAILVSMTKNAVELLASILRVSLVVQFATTQPVSSSLNIVLVHIQVWLVGAHGD